MEENIKQYIWNFFALVNQNFPQKTASKLEELKKEENQNKFYEYLELIFDLDNKLFIDIEEQYLDSFDTSNEIKIKELVNSLEITPYTNFTTKIKYIKISELIIKKIDSKSENTAPLYNNLASLYKLMGEYEKAKPLFEKALMIREEILGENHPDTASSYNNLALFYEVTGEYKKAKPLYDKALMIREEILGKNHPDTASSYDNLGSFYEFMGEYEKIISLYEKALKIREEILGENHPDTASSYINLASYYKIHAEYEKAKLFSKKALKIREETLGENHPDTAIGYSILGSLYRDLGDYKEAKLFSEKALKIREETLGENHINTASSYNNIASLYKDLGDYEEAKLFYEKAIKIREEILGENHPFTAICYNNIALLYETMMDHEKAIIFYEKAIKIDEKTFGENNLTTSTNYCNLALVYDSIEEYTKSKSLYEKSLKIKEHILGDNHPSNAVIYNNLATLYATLKEFEKVKPLYEKSLKLMLKTYNINHPNTKIIYKNYKNTQGKLNFICKAMGISPKVQEVKIENFKLLKDFKITLNDKINIIIGENSSGKTSLLQAITLGLLEEKYIGESNKKYHQYITKEKNSSKIILKVDNYEKEVTITPQERKVKNNIISPFVLSYGSNIFTRYKDEVTELVQDILNEKINKDFTISIFRDYTEEFYNPKSILNELSRNNGKESEEIEKIFKKIINDFLDDFELIKENDKYLFKHNNQIDFKLENLSEGYRNNILLISDILIRILGIGERPDTVEGIILIDEFDRHLHPKWQSNVVSKLSKNFPNIQFILTTHNPMSTLDREADEITIIKDIDGKLSAVKDNGTKNIDVGTILLKYFGVNSLVGETMQKNLKRFTELKLKDDDLSTDEEKEFKDLNDKLDETVATNFIYNNGYFKFLKFAKTHKDIDFNEMDDLSDIELDELLSDFEETL